MSFLDIESMAKKAGEIAGSHLKNPPKSRSFIVTFNRPRSVPPFLEQMTIKDPLIARSLNSAIVGGLVPNQESLHLIMARISEFQKSFNEQLLDQASGENWLEDYLEFKDFGIDYISEQYNTPSRSSLYKEMESTLESREKRIKYRLDIRQQHEMSASMTFMDVVDDLSDFIIHNCEGYESEDKVKKSMFSLVKTLESQASGTLFLDLGYSQNIHFALEDYSRHHKPEESLASMRSRFDVMDLKDEVSKGQRDLYGKMAPFTKAFLNKNFPKLTMKGLDRLSENEDAEVTLAKDFKGLSLSSVGSGHFQERMTPSAVHNRIQGQGDTFNECLGNSVIAYVYNLLQNRHEHAHKQALIEFSKEIESKSYLENAMALIESTRPALYRGESLDSKASQDSPGFSS